MKEQEWKPNPNEDFIERMLHRKDKSYVNLSIILLNIILFVIMEVMGGSTDSQVLLRFGAAYTPFVQNGEWYRLFTCMFLHAGIQHLLNNMLLLLFVGDYAERYMGRIRFLILYIGGGLAASLFSFYHQMMAEETLITMGASGAIFAVTGAMVVLIILHKGQLEELTLKRAAVMVVLSLLVGFQSAGVDGYAHLGGFLAGSLLAILLMLPEILRRS